MHRGAGNYVTSNMMEGDDRQRQGHKKLPKLQAVLARCWHSPSGEEPKLLRSYLFLSPPY